MGFVIDNQAIATGLAKCYCCKEKIVEGTVCIKVTGYKISGYCHKDCGSKLQSISEGQQ